MLRNSNNKGFTIIEVVITIAIGAAVMALVLNAVAGARRSQRNNARSSDVNKIAAAVNQYIASRNALPPDWAAIKNIVEEDSLGHYVGASVNAVNTWSASTPTAANKGKFTKSTVAPSTWADITDAQLGEDQLIVVQETACASNSSAEEAGIREMAIIYKLEGQSEVVCLEI